MGNMVAWWYKWRNVIWLFFLRSTKKTVSRNSISLLKKYHHTAAATCAGEMVAGESRVGMG